MSHARASRGRRCALGAASTASKHALAATLGAALALVAPLSHAQAEQPQPSHAGHQGQARQEGHEGHAGHEAHGGTATPPAGHAQMQHDATQHDATQHGAMQQGAMQHDAMSMRSAFGPYAMSREGSGTSWQPEATPMGGLHAMRGDWMLMAHGFANLVYDRQSGPRGDSKTFTQSMLMLMAQRPLEGGTFGLRAMLSADPVHGKSGYPLLFQTGETADGRTHLVDRQHPHDAFMELSASYSRSLAAETAVFVYGGLPGEPALGPPAFMHRFSGMRNPEAPLTHHWLDSTHITFGVLTLGASSGAWKVEGSWFNGREPDQRRWNIETRKLDSWSARLSYNPTREWAFQVSHGNLKSPEQLEPETRIRRTTASASYQTQAAGGQWQTTLAWGLNDKRGSHGSARLPGWLLESAYVRGRHTLFGRYEQVKNDELFAEGDPLHGEAFRIRKLSLGYVYDFAKSGPVVWGIGALIGVAQAPSRLDRAYGERPLSTMVFLQARL